MPIFSVKIWREDDFSFPQFGEDIWSYGIVFLEGNLDFPPLVWLGFRLRQEMMKRVTAFAQEKEKTYEVPTGSSVQHTYGGWRFSIFVNLNEDGMI